MSGQSLESGEPTFEPINSTTNPSRPSTSLRTFKAHLALSRRILIIVGAGISASSGIPTFASQNNEWRGIPFAEVANGTNFLENPGEVWFIYTMRAKAADRAEPTVAHRVVVDAVRRFEGSEGHEVCLVSQNIDELFSKAGLPTDHPAYNALHGSINSVTCTSPTCDYHSAQPLSLLFPKTYASINLATAYHLPTIPPPSLLDPLPNCPTCSSLLRPGVVMFGDDVPEPVLDRIWDFLGPDPPAAEERLTVPMQKLDLVLVVGTAARVTTVSSFPYEARLRGAKVVVVNVAAAAARGQGEGEDGVDMKWVADWFFKGGSDEMLPRLLGEWGADLLVPR